LGAVSGVIRVAASAASVSQADGWILAPFIAGRLPDKVTAIVYVSNSTRAVVFANITMATIKTNKIIAEVT
jgi:hypothetical protein